MPTLVCPKCKYHTENDERFCWKCGTELIAAGEPVFCCSCGAALKPFAEFCSRCGARRKISPDSVCGQCGAELKTGEHFCWKCGTKTVANPGEPSDADLERSYRKALEDYENQRYVAAVPELKKAASLGHPKAQYYLAECYRNGLGIRMDEAAGDEWAERARKQGIDENSIGDGRGELLEKAEQGDAYSQYQLGRSIIKHSFTSKTDYREDQKWLSKAAKQGYAPAQYLLASCFNCMANQKNCSGNKRKLKQKAFELYREAAEHGHAGALFALGECYDEGVAVKKNRKQAFQLYCRASEAGYQDSLILFTIGLCYDQGIGTPKNKNEAIRQYQMAIEHGDLLLAPKYLRKMERKID